MTLFSSLGARRLALLAVVFVLGVACAKVERNYGDDDSSAGAENGGTETVGGGGSGGKAGSGKGGSHVGGAAGEGGEAGTSEAGSGGENTAGAAGAPDMLSPTLTVTLAGDGTGVVSSDLPGINCGTACSAEFDPDTQVVLTATPSANSTFTGWSGGGCSGAGTCTTVVSAATEVKATFAAHRKFTVALAGNGSGAVKSVPAGIDCGTTCSQTVASGSSIQLTATPTLGSVFTGWSGGGCTGSGVCTTTVTASATVTATFTIATNLLTVVKAGTGVGTVTSAPAGINCGTDCNETLNYGTLVTLSAAVTAGTVFTGWSGGGCTGTGTCVVTVTAATQVTATFTCSPGTVQFNYTGTIVTFTPPSCVTALTIDAYGAQGGTSGTSLGGYGARIKGTFAVTTGVSLKVLVGGKGIDATDSAQQAGGSGGGGTFVTSTTNSPFVVAGGGGGAVNNGGSFIGAGLGGSIGPAGLADGSGSSPGGVSGNGGTSGSNPGYHSGTGGGGLLGDGVGNSTGLAASYGSPYTPGLAFVNGGAGGLPGSCSGATACLVGRAGGFGGGGAAGYTGGGGGGYSGGGGGRTSGTGTPVGVGGGGGSYNGGTAQTNTAATRAGNGVVIFTY